MKNFFTILAAALLAFLIRDWIVNKQFPLSLPSISTAKAVTPIATSDVDAQAEANLLRGGLT